MVALLELGEIKDAFFVLKVSIWPWRPSAERGKVLVGPVDGL
jgi:hypothetical protein